VFLLTYDKICWKITTPSSARRVMNRRQLIGNRVQIARDELGMSQEELGKLYRCSGVNIGRIERGIVGLEIAELERLASLLHKSRDWFLSDKVEVRPNPPKSALSDLAVSIDAFMPVTAEIGGGGGIEAIDYVATTRLRPVPESYRAYRLKGLSMEPEVREGDTVIVDTALTPSHNDLVVVIIDGKVSLKWYKEDGEGKKWLENHYGKYQPEEVIIHGVVVEQIHKRR
jgi:SOS-response transcriptional repressor LexA